MRDPETLDEEIAIALGALDRASPVAGDDRLTRVERLVRRADDAGFTAGARGLLAGHAAEARMLGYFLFGVFLRFGPPALPPIFETWRHALADGWDRLQPVGDRLRATTGALRWMLRNITQRIDFHAGLDDATYAGWRKAGHFGSETIAASAALRAAMGAALEDVESIIPLLAEVDARVRERFSRPKPAPAPAAASAETPEVRGGPAAPADGGATTTEASDPAAHGKNGITADGITADGITADGITADGITADGINREDDAGREHVAHASPPAPAAPGVIGANDTGDIAHPDPFTAARPMPGESITLKVSPDLWALLRRLDAFARLAEAGDLDRAAIVAADIDATLSDFDPRRYLSSLLGDHFRRLAAVADAMQTRDAEQSPARRSALEQLYRTDLDLFLV